MGNIQGTQFMDYDNENAISLRVEFESDKKRSGKRYSKNM
jgi:hypothetical protein